MKKLWLVSAALVILSTALHAQTLPILYNPMDPHSSAMGGAGVALEADAWSLDNNFAATALNQQVFAAGAAYNHWAPLPRPDKRFSAGGWFRLNNLSFGLSAKGSFFRPYDIVSPYGEVTGSFQPSDYAISLGTAWRPAPGFALSATGRLLSSSLAEEITGSTFCVDLGAMYRSQYIMAGVSACNLGGKIRYGDSEYTLPMLFKGGLSYYRTNFIATAELDYLAGAGLMGAVGAEFWPASIFFLRGGYHFGPSDKGLPSFGSCGAGLNMNGFGLEFSMLFASPTLGKSLCAGISYSF